MGGGDGGGMGGGWGAFGEEYASQQAAEGMQTLVSTPRRCGSIQTICKKDLSAQGPQEFCLHCTACQFG